MAAKVKVGDLVHCIFIDHAQSAEDALEFEIVGRLTDITKKAYKIHYWRYVNDVDRVSDENKKNNEDWYCIVKKAVISIRSLK